MAAVAVTIPDRHREFLLATLDAARDGLIFDLEEGLHAAPERARLEIEAYSRLAALASGERVAVDEAMRASLRELALSVDRMNEYERAGFEHAALSGMILRVERAGPRGGTDATDERPVSSGADRQHRLTPDAPEGEELMSTQDFPPPFAGWLEEHPDGGFLLLHTDGTRSPAICSYPELGEYLERVAAGEIARVEQVVRIGEIRLDVSDPLPNFPLYPPTDGREEES